MTGEKCKRHTRRMLRYHVNRMLWFCPVCPYTRPFLSSTKRVPPVTGRQGDAE